MKTYLEQMLRMEVNIIEEQSLFKSLPLLFKAKYKLYRVESNGVVWAAMEPKDVVGLPALRKHRALLEQKSNLNCAVFLKNSTFYMKEKMKEDGIPFVIEGKELYLPFLGVLLSSKAQRELKPVHQISFLTQKILLSGIYKAYDKATVSYVAEELGVSKMAVSKSFDEIEYLEIDVMDMKGKSRAITLNGDKKEIWERVKPYLRSPIIRKIALREDIGLNDKAGMSALAEYSMIADNNYPTYAVLKTGLRENNIQSRKEAIRGENIGCVVLEVGYFIDFIKKNTQDPLSVSMCVDDEIDDVRVEGAVEEMLEDYVW